MTGKAPSRILRALAIALAPDGAAPNTENLEVGGV